MNNCWPVHTNHAALFRRLVEGMVQVTASPENAKVPEVLGLFKNITASLVTVLLVYSDTTA